MSYLKRHPDQAPFFDQRGPINIKKAKNKPIALPPYYLPNVNIESRNSRYVWGIPGEIQPEAGRLSAPGQFKPTFNHAHIDTMRCYWPRKQLGFYHDKGFKTFNSQAPPSCTNGYDGRTRIFYPTARFGCMNQVSNNIEYLRDHRRESHGEMALPKEMQSSGVILTNSAALSTICEETNESRYLAAKSENPTLTTSVVREPLQGMVSQQGRKESKSSKDDSTEEELGYMATCQSKSESDRSKSPCRSEKEIGRQGLVIGSKQLKRRTPDFEDNSTEIRKDEPKLEEECFSAPDTVLSHEDIIKLLNERVKIKKAERRKETVACQIFGLLCLQGSRERRYEITVEELRRRVNTPEHLNKVDMISYLRLAKNSARQLLEKHDIISSLHHRLSRHTILSKVSERECEELANGIHGINTSYFPFEKFAKTSLANLLENMDDNSTKKENLAKRYKDLNMARSILMQFVDVMHSLEEDKEMKDFEMITHTFGTKNLSNHVMFFDRYFEEERKTILNHLKED